MAKYISMKEQSHDCIYKLNSAINKENAKYILPLLKWITGKINLILISESKRQVIKLCKEQNKKPPKVMKCSRGEIWEAYLGFNVGSEQNGVNDNFTRPVIILQNDENNRKSPNTIIAPLSKLENRLNIGEDLSKDELEKIKSELRPTEVLLNKDDVKKDENMLMYPSLVLCQNIREISKERLEYKITQIKDECWAEINNAIKFSLGIE